MRLIIPVVLFSLAAWFAFASGPVSLPETGVAAVSADDLSTDPLRALRLQQDMLRVGGVDQRCSDCHSLFESAAITPQELQQHTHIQLDHGVNNGCFNCHSRADHNQLELYGGALVPLERSEVLCAKCHGPTTRDWVAGMHGRTMGSWQRDDPAFRQLTCVECHDPHRPAVGAFEPLPGPNAWRAPAGEHHATGSPLNPLRRGYSTNGGASQGEENH